MSTSFSSGTGRSTSPTRSTSSGAPYRSWMTALIRSLPLIHIGRDRKHHVSDLLERVDVAVRFDDVVERVGAIDHGAILPGLEELFEQDDVRLVRLRDRE